MTRADRTDFLLLGAIVAIFVAAVTIAMVARTLGSRPAISNHSTYAQVVANFAGRPSERGHYLSGYSCAGYTAGHDGHGWVVIRCQK